MGYKNVRSAEIEIWIVIFSENEATFFPIWAAALKIEVNVL